MASLQRFSQKLGFAIASENQPLAGFYLVEVHEVAEHIEEDFPEHDGVPVAAQIEEILMPAVHELERGLDRADWGEVSRDYSNLVRACNECHTSTAHEYIEILPAAGTPPFNQRF
ncbi:MAG: hypothetical protein ACE5FL_02260 [Myxococcota bacterium]